MPLGDVGLDPDLVADMLRDPGPAPPLDPNHIHLREARHLRHSAILEVTREWLVRAAALTAVIREVLPAGTGAAVVSHDRRWLGTLAHRVMDLARAG